MIQLAQAWFVYVSETRFSHCSRDQFLFRTTSGCHQEFPKVRKETRKQMCSDSDFDILQIMQKDPATIGKLKKT